MKTLARTLAGAAVTTGALAFGCNLVLGIEEKEPRPIDASSVPEDPPARDAEPPPPAPSRCTSDDDCHAPNGCYQPRCDTTLGVCRYTLCASTRACAAGVCDPATFTCKDERDHGFRATGYPLADMSLACGKDPSACVAAAYPFLFVGTTTGLVALRIDDMRAAAPSTVPIAGLRLQPGRIVVSGARVWILGDVQGTAPPYVLPIASIDVPSDPTAPQIEAKSAVVEYPFPSATAFPAPGGDVFIAYDEPAQGSPVARVSGPIAADAVFGVAGPLPDGGAGASPPPSPPTHTMFRVGALPAGAKLVASSGERLVAYRFPVTFDLVSDPGTDRAAVAPPAALAPALPAYLVPSFAQGPGGAVLLAAPVNGDPAGDCNCTTHQRVQWVLPDAVAAAPLAGALVDPEAYSNPIATPTSPCHTCAYFVQPSLPAWIDATRALVAAPASDPPANRVRTAVRLVEREPAAAPPKRRFVLPAGDFAVDRIALSSSFGLGFLVVADAEGNGPRLSIFDPRCDAD